MSETLLLLGVFGVATAYSSVGHGGASGYLALWAFTAYSTQLGATLALVLNVIVAGLTFVIFRRAKHFDWKLTWPFLIFSIPLAYLGGRFAHQAHWQGAVLAVVLTYAAISLVFRPSQKNENPCAPTPSISAVTGGSAGFLSGLVGVGGGIFLSPLMILLNWAKPHTVASLSAVFIFLNSLAGLAARPADLVRQSVEFWPLILAGVAGALLGSWFGAYQSSSRTLRVILALILIVAAAKHLGQAVRI